MEITGSVYRIDQEESVSDKFKKRLCIIKVDGQYPEHIAVEFQQDRVDLLDPYKPGQQVTVSINLAGRLWTNPQGEEKCFVTLKGWKIQKVAGQEQAPPVAAKQALPNNTAGANEEPDGLDF